MLAVVRFLSMIVPDTHTALNCHQTGMQLRLFHIITNAHEEQNRIDLPYFLYYFALSYLFCVPWRPPATPGMHVLY